MNISSRLKAIFDYVDDNSRVVDVGCDHALLDIYLVNNLNNITCIASDINKNALNIARKNIDDYKLTNKIETVLSDGLDNLSIDNNTIIVISGMGTNTILGILNNKKSFLAKKIIIQSNNNLYELRSNMLKRGYIIEDETVVHDKGKYYVTILFKKGKIKYKNYELYFGPIILQKKDKQYLIYLAEKEKRKLKKIPKKYLFLRMKILFYLNKLTNYIK